jgi:excisionase family DNA binding protein
MISSRQAADKLGVTQRRIVALIKGGRLPAQRLGREWMIDEKSLRLVANRKPGRPVTSDKPRRKPKGKDSRG